MEETGIEAEEDPIKLFRRWLKEAEASEPNDPTAVALATSTLEGSPSVRMVLMKSIDDRGFSFFSFHRAKRPTPETLTTLKRTPGKSPTLYGREKESEISQYGLQLEEQKVT